jgi:hypothetical protein
MGSWSEQPQAMEDRRRAANLHMLVVLGRLVDQSRYHL